MNTGDPLDLPDGRTAEVLAVRPGAITVQIHNPGHMPTVTDLDPATLQPIEERP